MGSHRNKFVIRKESGHPGYESTTILATKDDLSALAREIQTKLEEGYRPPMISHYATEAHGRSSRIYLQFEPASDETLEDYHKTKHPMWEWVLRPLFGLLAVTLMVVGAVRSWHWLTSGNW